MPLIESKVEAMEGKTLKSSIVRAFAFSTTHVYQTTCGRTFVADVELKKGNLCNGFYEVKETDEVEKYIVKERLKNNLFLLETLCREHFYDIVHNPGRYEAYFYEDASDAYNFALSFGGSNKLRTMACKEPEGAYHYARYVDKEQCDETWNAVKGTDWERPYLVFISKHERTY